MPETWPTSVPYQVQPGSFRISMPFRKPRRTEMEDGPKRIRRSTTKKITTVQFKLIPLTGAQYRTFSLWVSNTLVDGSLSFNMPVFMEDDTYEDRVCTMAEDFNMNDIGWKLREVSLALDIDDYTQEA